MYERTFETEQERAHREAVEKQEREIESAYFRLWRRRIGKNPGFTIFCGAIALVFVMLGIANPVKMRDLIVGLTTIPAIIAVCCFLIYRLYKWIQKWGNS